MYCFRYLRRVDLSGRGGCFESTFPFPPAAALSVPLLVARFSLNSRSLCFDEPGCFMVVSMIRRQSGRFLSAFRLAGRINAAVSVPDRRMTEADALREYAQSRSQSAFAELVARHVDLVYSSALRQVHGD